MVKTRYGQQDALPRRHPANLSPSPGILPPAGKFPSDANLSNKLSRRCTTFGKLELYRLELYRCTSDFNLSNKFCQSVGRFKPTLTISSDVDFASNKQIAFPMTMLAWTMIVVTSLCRRRDYCRITRPPTISSPRRRRQVAWERALAGQRSAIAGLPQAIPALLKLYDKYCQKWLHLREYSHSSSERIIINLTKKHLN